MSAGWTVTFDAGTAFVVGPKSDARRRLAACGDRSPLWVPRRQAWATTPAAARAVLDQLDARRIAYTVTDAQQLGIPLTVDDLLPYGEPEQPAERPNWPGIRPRTKGAS